MSATNQPKSGAIAEPRKPYHHGDLRRAIIASATRRARHSGERAIVLREIEGMSYEEIARAMDCPGGTVRSRIFRAREAIDGRIGPLMRYTDED